MTADPVPRPRPVLEGFTGEFYDHCARHDLRFQRCSTCGAWRHPPRVLCAVCGSPRWAWEPSSGRGQVFSWTVVHQPMHPAFASVVPYAVLVVETTEGVRLVSNLVDAGPELLRLGLPVEVAYERIDDELTLPMFRPSDA